jgi:wobble nucleotide-excising tRNase
MDTTQGAAGASSMDTSSQLADLKQQVNAALSSADTQASNTVQNLQLIHKARASVLTRAAATAVAQYGSDSPQAKQAEAAVTATQNTVARISVLHQQLTTEPPQASTSGWVLQGRVFNAQLQPVSGYTVFLVDATKAYQQAYGFAYTDETGYFVLNYAGTAKGTLSPGQSTITLQLFIEVANTKNQPVYLSTTAFQPALGSVSYQNIVLPAGEQPIGDPPEAIRKIALPPKT